MHGHDQGHGRLLRFKSVLHAVFAKTTAAPIQATKLKLDEQTRWQIPGEAPTRATNDAPGLEANRLWHRSSPRRTGEADLTLTSQESWSGRVARVLAPFHLPKGSMAAMRAHWLLPP